MRRPAGRGRGALVVALGMACWGCAGEGPEVVEQPLVGTLAPLAAVLVPPHVPFAAPVVSGGAPPQLLVTGGHLPQGLVLSESGVLEGVPALEAELARFTLEARNQHGEPLESRDYVVAVGVGASSLRAPPDPVRVDDMLMFHHDWGLQLSRAFAWDPQLGLAWPMRVGAGFVGRALAPMGAAMSVVVSGPEARGQFVLQQAPVEDELHIVAQLTWEGEADIDLRLLGSDGEELVPGGAALPGGIRHYINETSGPGPEVIGLGRSLAPGRWALVATRAGGTQVDVPLWLSIRRRDGLVLSDVRIDALFSDVASGTLQEEVESGRQSYRPLGVLEVGVDREVSFTLVQGPRPFGDTP